MRPTSHPPSSSHSRTQELVRRALEGSEAAWAELFELHRVALILAIREHLDVGLGFLIDHEDVLQQSFVTAHSSLSDFEYRGPGSFRGWLRRIAVTRTVDELRKHRRRQPELWIEETPSTELAQRAVDDPPPGPSEHVSANEQEQRLLECLGRLSDDDQEVLVMRIFEKKTFRAIGEVLECGRNSARERFEAARVRLLRALGE